jgi:hypothetical protein
MIDQIFAYLFLSVPRDADDVSNLCAFRNTSAARSPMTMHGAMVLPVITRAEMALPRMLGEAND